MSAQSPNRWTGMMPTVCGVMRLSMSSVRTLKVARSTSQNTGLAPMYSTTFAVETHVNAGTMTSSPGFNPSAATAIWSAVVQELVATEWEADVNAENRSSNSFTKGPCTTQPVSRGFWTASISAAPKNGFVIGIVMYRLAV